MCEVKHTPLERHWAYKGVIGHRFQTLFFLDVVILNAVVFCELVSYLILEAIVSSVNLLSLYATLYLVLFS